MDGEKLKNQIGRNITAYRKREDLTQAQLGELLSYSDKAVSKWERGESVPDVLVLAELARRFGVTVDELLADPDALPGDPGAVSLAVEKTLKGKADKNVILMLCSVLVWGVALLLYVVLASLRLKGSWTPFVYALPVNAIVLLSLRSAWRDFRWNRGLISAIVWGSLLSIYITLLVFCRLHIWRVLLLGIPGQAAVCLWFRLYRKKEVPNE